MASGPDATVLSAWDGRSEQAAFGWLPKGEPGSLVMASSAALVVLVWCGPHVAGVGAGRCPAGDGPVPLAAKAEETGAGAKREAVPRLAAGRRIGVWLRTWARPAAGAMVVTTGLSRRAGVAMGAADGSVADRRTGLITGGRARSMAGFTMGFTIGSSTG